MIEFAFYNPSDDKRSCVVRTLTKLSGRPYAEVKCELEALAAETSLPTYNDEVVFVRYLQNIGFRKMQSEPGLLVGDLRFRAAHTAFSVQIRTAFIICCH